ncbi:MAG: hypothetical protein MZV63_24970 [Marinilabiliales bacterium]|nr:hypothetical protein [Marinilabiliales bacterium]
MTTDKTKDMSTAGKKGNLPLFSGSSALQAQDATGFSTWVHDHYYYDDFIERIHPREEWPTTAIFLPTRLLLDLIQ